MSERAVVLFSGGSDCTLAAARVAAQKRFDEIILLTYLVPVSCLDGNSKRNIPGLERAFPDVSFRHEMVPVDGVLDTVLTTKKLRFVLKYGLQEASLCLHCRLAMYVRTIMYCLEEDIRHVFDGSNVTMALWVDQTSEGVTVVDELFAQFGITLEHPVFYYAGDDLFDLKKYYATGDNVGRLIDKSTSEELHEIGVVPRADFKADYVASYRAQPVCLGVVMSLMHSLGRTLPFTSYERFNQRALAWYRDKTSLFASLLRQYQHDPVHSTLGRACQEGRGRASGDIET